jgi:ribokinase
MKVLTIGSAMIDTIAIIGSARIERMTMLNAESSFLLLEEGRKTEAEEVYAGGGAFNAAVAMARLGMDELSAVVGDVQQSRCRRDYLRDL